MFKFKNILTYTIVTPFVHVILFSRVPGHLYEFYLKPLTIAEFCEETLIHLGDNTFGLLRSVLTVACTQVWVKNNLQGLYMG